jgi:hypothetical protein
MTEHIYEPEITPEPKLAPAAKKVLDAFREHGAMTDDDLVERTGLVKGTASPRRGDLVKYGMVRAVDGTRPTVWELVPPEQVAGHRAAAAQRGPRKKAYTKFTLDEKLDAVRQLLDMPDVNDAIRDRHGKAWGRARRVAQENKGARKRELRDLQAQINKGAPYAEFLKLKRNLIKATEGVRAIRGLVEEELDRQGTVRRPEIPVAQWPEVTDLLNDLNEIVNDTMGQIRDVMGAFGPDVIEGTVVDIDDFLELPEGDSEADVA